MHNYLLILAILVIICLVFDLLPTSVNVILIQIVTILILATCLDDADIITGGNPQGAVSSVSNLIPDFQKIITNANAKLINTDKVQYIHISDKYLPKYRNNDARIEFTSLNKILEESSVPMDIFNKRVLKYALAMYLYIVVKPCIGIILTPNAILANVPINTLSNYVATASRRLNSIKDLTISNEAHNDTILNMFSNLVVLDGETAAQENMLVSSLVTNNTFDPLNDQQLDTLFTLRNYTNIAEKELFRYGCILYAVYRTLHTYSYDKYKLLTNTENKNIYYDKNVISTSLVEAMNSMPLRTLSQSTCVIS